MKAETWQDLFRVEIKKDYYRRLMGTVKHLYANNVSVLPPQDEIFNAFINCNLQNVKVCIIGQDPYPTKNVAHGLAFSVKPGIKVPESLKNIYKELEHEGNFTIPNHGYLMDWAKQGVFLLNTSLTVEEGKPDSHRGLGWEQLTTEVIKTIDDSKDYVVYLLWGNKARAMKKYITNPNHLVLEAVHPSPLSFHRGFIGCNHFKMANEYLQKHDITPVNWQLPLNI